MSRSQHQEVGSLTLSMGVGLCRRCVSGSLCKLRPMLWEDAFVVLVCRGGVFLSEATGMQSRRCDVVRGLVTGFFDRFMLQLNDTWVS